MFSASAVQTDNIICDHVLSCTCKHVTLTNLYCLQHRPRPREAVQMHRLRQGVRQEDQLEDPHPGSPPTNQGIEMSDLRQVVYKGARHEAARQQHSRQVARVCLRVLPEVVEFKTISEEAYEGLLHQS